MKILLCAINAKYIHTSLAIRSLKAYCGEYRQYIETIEFTINNSEDYILSGIYNIKPTVVCFSCYIWNINIVLQTAENLKKLLPQVYIILGGPEVSYEYDDIINREYIDMIITGEGEKPFKEAAAYFIDKKGSLNDIHGLVFKQNGIVSTSAPDIVPLDDIPFVYDETDSLKHKIIYYEASRGCPYSCQYCLSSATGGVRFLSLERIKSDLSFFLNNNVKQVKFVDRTFNCNKKTALEIWSFLIENDNNITNFHFEISADILDNDMLNILKKARPGLFQLEIGIQSTNEITLSNIQRKTNQQRLFENIRKIKSFGNIHQHLDLIIGLPDEDYTSFKKSFNDVYSLYPQQLQLGFLKLLKGSGLRKDSRRFEICFKSNAPYEVLFTRAISYDKIQLLKSIENTVEAYYNSGKAIYSLRYAIGYFSSPFDFYERFAIYWKENALNHTSHSKLELYKILYDFCLKHNIDNLLKDFIRFDILCNDNLKNLPNEFSYEHPDEIKVMGRAFYTNKSMTEKYLPAMSNSTSRQLSKLCAFDCFNANIPQWIKDNYQQLKQEKCFILFDYNGENIKFHEIEFSENELTN